MIKKMFLVVLTAGIFVTSCSDDDDNNDSNLADLTVNLSGLEVLGSDFVYEGWIIVDENPVSTGTFSSIDFPQTYEVDATQLAVATAFVLSIEPAVDPDPAPAPTKILVGEFNGDTANVWIGTITPDSNDFSNSWGKFFLATPTDNIDGNDESGIWFGVPGTMPPAPGFGLPTLAEGWRYEGWVVTDNGPITTGTFTAFDVADDTNQFSGTDNSAPPIPGEDFLNEAPEGFTFPLDVRGKTVVISIEPSPDNSPSPFLLKPLSVVAGQETAPTTYDLAFSSGSFPYGTVTR